MTDFNMPPGVSARDIPGQDEAPGLVDQLQAAASRASWPEDADLMTEAGAEIARLRSQVTTATNLIGAGLDLMTDEQVGQWAGVRTFLEQDTSDYLPIGEVIAERDRLRAEVEALRGAVLAEREACANKIRDLRNQAVTPKFATMRECEAYSHALDAAESAIRARGGEK